MNKVSSLSYNQNQVLLTKQQLQEIVKQPNLTLKRVDNSFILERQGSYQVNSSLISRVGHCLLGVLHFLAIVPIFFYITDKSYRSQINDLFQGTETVDGLDITNFTLDTSDKKVLNRTKEVQAKIHIFDASSSKTDTTEKLSTLFKTELQQIIQNLENPNIGFKEEPLSNKSEESSTVDSQQDEQPKLLDNSQAKPELSAQSNINRFDIEQETVKPAPKQRNPLATQLKVSGLTITPQEIKGKESSTVDSQQDEQPKLVDNSQAKPKLSAQSNINRFDIEQEAAKPAPKQRNPLATQLKVSGLTITPQEIKGKESKASTTQTEAPQALPPKSTSPQMQEGAVQTVDFTTTKGSSEIRPASADTKTMKTFANLLQPHIKEFEDLKMVCPAINMLNLSEEELKLIQENAFFIQHNYLTLDDVVNKGKAITAKLSNGQKALLSHDLFKNLTKDSFFELDAFLKTTEKLSITYSKAIIKFIDILSNKKAYKDKPAERLKEFYKAWKLPKNRKKVFFNHFFLDLYRADIITITQMAKLPNSCFTIKKGGQNFSLEANRITTNLFELNLTRTVTNHFGVEYEVGSTIDYLKGPIFEPLKCFLKYGMISLQDIFYKDEKGLKSLLEKKVKEFFDKIFEKGALIPFTESEARKIINHAISLLKTNWEGPLKNLKTRSAKLLRAAPLFTDPTIKELYFSNSKFFDKYNCDELEQLSLGKNLLKDGTLTDYQILERHYGFIEKLNAAAPLLHDNAVSESEIYELDLYMVETIVSAYQATKNNQRSYPFIYENLKNRSITIKDLANLLGYFENKDLEASEKLFAYIDKFLSPQITFKRVRQSDGSIIDVQKDNIAATYIMHSLNGHSNWIIEAMQKYELVHNSPKIKRLIEQNKLEMNAFIQHPISFLRLLDDKSFHYLYEFFATYTPPQNQTNEELQQNHPFNNLSMSLINYLKKSSALQKMIFDGQIELPVLNRAFFQLEQSFSRQQRHNYFYNQPPMDVSIRELIGAYVSQSIIEDAAYAHLIDLHNLSRDERTQRAQELERIKATNSETLLSQYNEVKESFQQEKLNQVRPQGQPGFFGQAFNRIRSIFGRG